MINFAAAYIPYIGAWSAGAFTVLIALGGEGAGVAGGESQAGRCSAASA